MCVHETVVVRESMNPRMPLVQWVCTECGARFEPVRTRVRVRREDRRAARKLRRDLARWRNG